RSGWGSTLTPTGGTTPARRQAPRAPSAATMVPTNPDARRRSRLRRRCRLGPAPTTMASSPVPRGVSASSSTERAMRGRFSSALASPTAATRSKVAASSASAIFRPSSIRLRLLVPAPDQALLAHETDAAPEAGERLLLELVRGIEDIGLVLDGHVHLVVALEKLRHDQLLLARPSSSGGPPFELPLVVEEAGRRRVRSFCAGIPIRPRAARCWSGLSKVAMTMPSTSAVGSSDTGRMGRPRNWPPPSPANTPTGSRPNSFRVW